MTPIPVPAVVADRLRSENAALRELVDRYKERERFYVRAIDHLMDTPATSVVAVKQSGKTVDVFFDTGAVWRRVTRCFESPSEVRFFEDYVPVQAVPTTRPAIVQDLNERIAKLPLPERVA